MRYAFRDRIQAGRRLGTLLGKYAGRPDVQVIGLPRGGVPVAYEVARTLHAPLDVFVVRKLGVPGNEELALGALAPGGICVFDPGVVRALDIPSSQIENVVARERRELARQERLYRRGRPHLEVRNKTVILVDDGLATGSSMRAALIALRRMRPASLVVASPVGAPDVCEGLRGEVDDLLCIATPESFTAVGEWYEDFSPVSDEQVRDLLARAMDQAA